MFEHLPEVILMGCIMEIKMKMMGDGADGDRDDANADDADKDDGDGGV